MARECNMCVGVIGLKPLSGHFEQSFGFFPAGIVVNMSAQHIDVSELKPPLSIQGCKVP
jgi:hypothetical protein